MDQAMTHFFGGGYTQASFLTEIQADSGNGLSNGVMFVKNNMNLGNTDTGAIGGADVGNGPVRSATDVLTNRDSGYSTTPLRGFTTSWQNLGTGVTATRSASIQVGANKGETNDLQLGALSVTALGLSDVDMVGNAKISIVHLDDALTYINSQRAMLGAQISRLENTISNLATASEAGSASQSRVVDADYATETAQLTRARILQQAGTAILAQANSQQGRVLQLLR
jgi:flagellin